MTSATKIGGFTQQRPPNTTEAIQVTSTASLDCLPNLYMVEDRLEAINFSRNKVI
jgi:hypothetical protein